MYTHIRRFNRLYYVYNMYKQFALKDYSVCCIHTACIILQESLDTKYSIRGYIILCIYVQSIHINKYLLELVYAVEHIY